MMHGSMLMLLFVQKLKKSFLINFVVYKRRKLSKEHHFFSADPSPSLHVSLIVSHCTSMCLYFSAF
jgi:hypothetical protein